MLAAYGIDVLDPQVSTRRVHTLMERLPPQYRLPGEQWTVEADLLAALVDQVAYLAWITLKANGVKNAPRPRPVKRPPRRITGAARGGGQAVRPAAAGQPPTGTGKASSWFEAATMLAGMQGVVTTHE